MLTAEQVRALTRDTVERRLVELIARAPIEVAVVGDIDRATATDLVASAARRWPICAPCHGRRRRSA